MAHTYQVIIIGAGASGAGLARDLALRGVDCLLLERGDVNAGASGRNHGLLHSGARYAVVDPRAAAECAREGAIIKRILPQCVDDCGGLFVAVPGEGDSFKAERRSVTLGAEYGDAWLALDGLQAGDKVIVGGAHSVRNGGPVTVVTEAQLEAEAAARTGRATLAAEAEVSAGGQA